MQRVVSGLVMVLSLGLGVAQEPGARSTKKESSRQVRIDFTVKPLKFHKNRVRVIVRSGSSEIVNSAVGRTVETLITEGKEVIVAQFVSVGGRTMYEDGEKVRSETIRTYRVVFRGFSPKMTEVMSEVLRISGEARRFMRVDENGRITKFSLSESEFESPVLELELAFDNEGFFGAG